MALRVSHFEFLNRQTPFANVIAAQDSHISLEHLSSYYLSEGEATRVGGLASGFAA